MAKRAWKIQTQDEEDDALVAECLGREQEVLAYDTNIDKFERLAGGIADEWSPALEQYRHANLQQLALSLDDVTFALVSRLRFKDELRARLRTERAERDKALAVLNVVTGMLPSQQRVDAAARRVRLKMKG